MATSNEIRLRDLLETIRNDRTREALEAEANSLKRRGLTDQEIIQSLDLARKWMADLNNAAFNWATKNEYSWYTYFDKMITSKLKQAIECLAGVGLVDASDGFYQLNDPDIASIHVTEHKQNIAVFEFMPTVGSNDGWGATTAIASKNFNNLIRGDNSGSTNYDAIDLFKYPLAVDAPIYMLHWLSKVLALANYKDARNPGTVSWLLLKAACYNNNTLVSVVLNNRAVLVDIYNQAVADLNTLCIPFQMPFIQRHAWLASTVFSNNPSDSVGLQFYMFTPKAYFIYNELTGQLQCKDVAYTLNLSSSIESVILNNIRVMFNNMLAPLTNGQTVATMSGDIKKYYGEGIKFPTMELNEISKLSPRLETDIKYLQSIKNAEIVAIKGHSSGSYADFTIYEGTDSNMDPFLHQGTYSGVIYKGPEVLTNLVTLVNADEDGVKDARVYPPLDGRYIDYYDCEHISEEDQCYNLSFVNTYTLDNSTLRLNACRSEILVSMTLHEARRNSIGSIQYVANTYSSNFIVRDSGSDRSDFISDVNTASKFGSFDFIPCMTYVAGDLDTTENYGIVVWNRNYNRNYVRRQLIQGIQHAALLSMFMPASSKPMTTSSDSSSSNKDNRNPKRKSKRKGKKKNNTNK